MNDFPELLGWPRMVQRAEGERSRFYQYRLEEIEKREEKEGSAWAEQQKQELLIFCRSIYIAENWVRFSNQILDKWRRGGLFLETQRERMLVRESREQYDKIAERLKNRQEKKWLKELELYFSDVHTLPRLEWPKYWPLSKLQRFMITSQFPVDEERYVQYEMNINRCVEFEQNRLNEWQDALLQAIKDGTLSKLAETVKDEFVEEDGGGEAGRHPLTRDVISIGPSKTRYYPKDKEGKDLIEWVISVYVDRIMLLQQWRLDVPVPKFEK